MQEKWEKKVNTTKSRKVQKTFPWERIEASYNPSS